MYHYTYLIYHKTTNKKYIGVRSSTEKPENDIDYWGSSVHLPQDVKETHLKEILQVFTNREDAVRHEVQLHLENNVAVNPEYYNRSKQTTTKFDTSGTSLTEEHKQKCSIALKGRVVSKETREKIAKAKLGVPRSKETAEKSRQYMLAANNSSIKNSNFKPWFISWPTITHLFYDITKVEKAIQDGVHSKQYTSLYAQYKKSGKPITRGLYKDVIVSNIPNS